MKLFWELVSPSPFRYHRSLTDYRVEVYLAVTCWNIQGIAAGLSFLSARLRRGAAGLELTVS